MAKEREGRGLGQSGRGGEGLVNVLDRAVGVLPGLELDGNPQLLEARLEVQPLRAERRRVDCIVVQPAPAPTLAGARRVLAQQVAQAPKLVGALVPEAKLEGRPRTLLRSR